MNRYTNYFTVGEMASMFGISKQTLQYYNKVGLLSPAFISQNGYRHYSADQYMTLEVIINMRSLGFSIADIKDYLENRSKDRFFRLLKKRNSECEKIISDTEKIRNAVLSVENALHTDARSRLNQITLVHKPQQIIRITALDSCLTGKERLMLYAAHCRKMFRAPGNSTEKHLGWILDAKTFFSPQPSFISKAFFSYAPPLPSSPPLPETILREGLYLELYFQGTFIGKAKALAKKTGLFLQRNSLSPEGKIFIYPVENHLMTSHTEEYINKIFFPVISSQ